MRLPNEAMLSREQREVCFAPTDSSILVTGPPGSGKTVVAIFRSNSLSEQDEDVKVVAFNQVLASYTSMDSTFLTWLSNWWRAASGSSFPKKRVDGRNTNDYITAAQNAREEKSERITEKGHWGHLILDEAQDFNFGAHSFLNTVRERVFSEFADEDKPHVTILADENQRLNDSNSTIEQIRQAHLFSSDDEYELKRNYRNTMEIAKFAAEFYVGLPTGIPDLPDARGNKPKVVVTDDIDDAVSRITTHARTNDNEEIGVLVHYDRTRKKLFNKLKHRLEDDGFTVQTYGWRDGRDGARELQFDKPKTITVLCFASAKGLEFDTVFLPELQTYGTTDAAELSAKMTMYVMCSRARKTLSLMISDRDGDNDIWRLLPADRQLYELED